MNINMSIKATAMQIDFFIVSSLPLGMDAEISSASTATQNGHAPEGGCYTKPAR